MTATYHEPAREVPVIEQADVIVCGAGPAGVVAAIAAARQGASTVLIETHGCLGGVWTAGLVTLIIDSENKGGIMQEINDQLIARDAKRGRAYDAEVMKLLLEEMCLQAGVKIRLHTHVTAAYRDENNRMSHVVTESKSGREAWTAKAFIDCTGDGDLAAAAGCGYDLGMPGTGQMQPMSLLALLTGIDYHALNEKRFVRGGSVEPLEAKAKVLPEFMRSLGVDPSYGHPTLLPIRDDLFAFMTNHEYHRNGTNADDVTQATLSARAELHKIVDTLRSSGGVWANVRIVATGAQIGVREGRRIHGRYNLTVEDLKRGVRFDDAVCRARFGLDVHSTDPTQTKAIAKTGIRVQPYDIPLRALIARDVDGLMMAGRCISGDFLAHSSYRVTGNAAVMGEAAGVTSALAAKAGCCAHQVPFEQVQPWLGELVC